VAKRPDSKIAALSEFALIARYFTRACNERQGVGDDCALIDVGAQTLAITTDMLLEGVHFFTQADPQALGHKALAVNLSDLAAAGARPRCFVLGIAIPRPDEEWLAAFSRGLFALADQYRCALVGGDTSRSKPVDAANDGRTWISITAIGEVDRVSARGRSGAQPGDDIWVSGRLGEAALALAIRRGQRQLPSPDREACLRRMDWPQPRVELGLALAGLASAAIDVSDGLIGDLGHVLERSGVGARVIWPSVPRPEFFEQLDVATQQQLVLAGGDDYELLFTAPVSRRAPIEALTTKQLALTRIGQIEAAPGLRVVDGSGALIKATLHSFDHFLSGT
jgi:thiamine-monophosphate kinase